MQYYLIKSIPVEYKVCITKLRLSAHNLTIETGRYKSINRSQRIYTLCNKFLAYSGNSIKNLAPLFVFLTYNLPFKLSIIIALLMYNPNPVP